LKDGRYTISGHVNGFTALQADEAILQAITPEAFEKASLDSIARYGDEHQLPGLVVRRVFASSPDATMLATCITVDSSVPLLAVAPGGTLVRTEFAFALFTDPYQFTKVLEQLGSIYVATALLWLGCFLASACWRPLSRDERLEELWGVKVTPEMGWWDVQVGDV
jgi:hypothetical protein